MKLKINKKAISQVISSLLLILLVIASITIIMGFVIPLIKDQLSEGTECLDVQGEIEIKNNPLYTCYNDDIDHLILQIHIGSIRDLINSIKVVITISGSSQTYEIDPEDHVDILMYDPAQTFELPNDNEERTYRITGINNLPDSISVYPVLENEKDCAGTADTLTYIDLCTN